MFVGIAIVLGSLLFMFALIVNYAIHNSVSKKNPYVAAHLRKEQNDTDYDNYKVWLNKRGFGIPIEKVLTNEDKGVINQIKNLMK